MPKFIFSDPVDINPEDEVAVESEIKAGSVVVFERRGGNTVVIRALPSNEIQDYVGSKYVVSKGGRPGDIKFSILKRGN